MELSILFNQHKVTALECNKKSFCGAIFNNVSAICNIVTKSLFFVRLIIVEFVRYLSFCYLFSFIYFQKIF